MPMTIHVENKRYIAAELILDYKVLKGVRFVTVYVMLWTIKQKILYKHFRYWGCFRNSV